MRDHDLKVSMLEDIVYNRDSFIIAGNLEKLDLSFIYWVLFKSRSLNGRKFYKELKNKYGTKKVITFKNRKKVNNYLKEIGIFDFKERA